MNQATRVREDMIALFAQQDPRGGVMQPKEIDAAFFGLRVGNQAAPGPEHIFCLRDGSENTPETVALNYDLHHQTCQECQHYDQCRVLAPDNPGAPMRFHPVGERSDHIVRCPAAGPNMFLSLHQARAHHTKNNAMVCAQCGETCMD